MKDKSEVIQEFNELVNMTALELEKWLKSDDSNSAGWPKEDANGETVGHDSGRKIVGILKDNPEKDPEQYTGDQIGHMRKVVSYCKRHLAQETKGNNDKSEEEVKKTKSYASLKNWGHDFLKARDQNRQEDDGEEKKAGEKRKTDTTQSSSNKKQETQKGEAKRSADEEGAEERDGDEEEEQAEPANGKDSNGHKTGSKEESQGQDEDEDGEGGSKGPKKGQTVTWNWGGGQPEGKVLDVKDKKTTITTKKGNEVSRKGDPEDPAVVLDTGKSKAIKLSHELNETS